MLSAHRMLWVELKGKMPPLGYIVHSLERMLSSTCSTDLQHETEHRVCLTRLGSCLFCVETQISGHSYQDKDCVAILPMHDEKSNANNIFSSVIPFSLPNSYQTKNTRPQKREELMNYGQCSCTQWYAYSAPTYKSRGQKKKTRYFPS